jgi:hypothetical protein
MGWLINAAPRPQYPWERDLVHIVQKAGWALGAGLDGWGKSRNQSGFNPRTVQPIAGN